MWHNGLLYKLASIKTPHYIFKMIESFIRDRNITVKINNTFSSIRKISCGVPRGAVLSPTLFNISINDLPIRSSDRSNMNTGEYTILYADDIAYLLKFKDKKEAQIKAQKYFDEIEQWMNRWRLTLAPHKCSQTVFSRSRKFDITELNINLYNAKIPKENEPKCLGIKFDRRLNFGSQIKNIKEKTSDRVNIIKILSYDKNLVP